MRSRIYLVVSLVALLCAIAYTQSAVTGVSVGFTGVTGSCDAPAAGRTIFCIATSPVDAKISVNGAAYVSLKGANGTNGTNGVNGTNGAAGAPGAPGAVGAVGAVGPAGIAGPQGAAGADGKPGSSWSTCPFTVTALKMDGTGGASGTLTIDPTKCQ